MNIGDKVRSMRGPEEGIITAYVNDREVEVEIEDGFRIPFLKSDLVVVSKEEEKAFGKGEAQTNTGRKRVQKQQKPEVSPAAMAVGTYLAFIYLNERVFEAYLINNTDYKVLYTLGEETEKHYKGISAGMATKRSYHKVHQLSVASFDEWPRLVMQLLFHLDGHTAYQPPMIRQLKFRAASFKKHEGQVPLMGKDGFVFHLQEAGQPAKQPPVPVSADAIKEQWEKNAWKEAEPAKDARPSRNQHAPKSREIDLHAEKLMGNLSGNSQPEHLLALQIDVFERELDRAIQDGLDEVIFIHGVGSGVLRNEIQRRLSQDPQIAWFKDAQREKFGYGATLGKIK